MKRLMIIFVLVFAVGIHAAAPAISYKAEAELFTVTFDAGYVAACTIYQSTIDTIELDGKVVPYAPAHCGPLSVGVEQTAYVDDWDFIVLVDGHNVPVPDGGDWDVWAELYTEDGTATRTNVLRLHH